MQNPANKEDPEYFFGNWNCILGCSSDIWAVCLCVWSYQQRSATQTCACCQISWTNAGSYLISSAPSALNLSWTFQIPSPLQSATSSQAFFPAGEDLLCSLADFRQTSARWWWFHSVTVFPVLKHKDQGGCKGDEYVWKHRLFVAEGDLFWQRDLTAACRVRQVLSNLFRCYWNSEVIQYNIYRPASFSFWQSQPSNPTLCVESAQVKDLHFASVFLR